MCSYSVILQIPSRIVEDILDNSPNVVNVSNIQKYYKTSQFSNIKELKRIVNYPSEFDTNCGIARLYCVCTV